MCKVWKNHPSQNAKKSSEVVKTEALLYGVTMPLLRMKYSNDAKLPFLHSTNIDNSDAEGLFIFHSGAPHWIRIFRFGELDHSFISFINHSTTKCPLHSCYLLITLIH